MYKEGAWSQAEFWFLEALKAPAAQTSEGTLQLAHSHSCCCLADAAGHQLDACCTSFIPCTSACHGQLQP